MTGKIIVTPQFKKDFDEYCAMHEFDKYEIEHFKEAVRAKFALTGVFIQKYMAIHRWMISTWGYKPSHDLLIGYLNSKRIFINTKIYGYNLLAEFCYDHAMSEQDHQD